MLVTFYLNEVQVTYDVKPGEYLAYTLRQHGVKSVKVGCNESSCGSCTLLVEGKPMMSCSLLTASIEGKHITTVEGIQEEAAKISKCFSNEGADQCGFCNVGLALTIYALKREYKNPTDEEINNYIVGNLCRCTGLQSQLKAVKAYLKEE
jgi:carbon-monoxide dehydrogenase small subunit